MRRSREATPMNGRAGRVATLTFANRFLLTAGPTKARHKQSSPWRRGSGHPQISWSGLLMTQPIRGQTDWPQCINGSTNEWKRKPRSWPPWIICAVAPAKLRSCYPIIGRRIERPWEWRMRRSPIALSISASAMRVVPVIRLFWSAARLRASSRHSSTAGASMGLAWQPWPGRCRSICTQTVSRVSHPDATRHFRPFPWHPESGHRPGRRSSRSGRCRNRSTQRSRRSEPISLHLEWWHRLEQQFQ